MRKIRLLRLGAYGAYHYGSEEIRLHLELGGIAASPFVQRCPRLLSIDTMSNLCCAHCSSSSPTSRLRLATWTPSSIRTPHGDELDRCSPTVTTTPRRPNRVEPLGAATLDQSLRNSEWRLHFPETYPFSVSHSTRTISPWYAFYACPAEEALAGPIEAFGAIAIISSTY